MAKSVARRALQKANRDIASGKLKGKKLKAAEEKQRTARIVVKAEVAAKGKSKKELREARTEEMKARGPLSGQAKFDEALQARVYADALRAVTGRQKGERTPYTGPGATVKLDAKGNIVRGPQGRVKYEIDEEAYAKRFIPQFTPTQEQLDMGLNIQPGLLTPWQQTNYQWLLGQEGLAPTAGGRIPTDFRQDWRTEQWGDVYDKKTGLWKRADPDKRQAAVAEQLRRYEAGEFNPTVGSVAGDRWTGQGVGVASADQWLPPGWTPPGGGGGGGGAYRRPAPLDWSAIMPTDTPLASQRALVAGKGKFYQPWATRQATPRALINYQGTGGAGVDVGYSNPNLGLFDFNGGTTANGGITTKPGEPAGWVGPIDPKTGKAFPSFMAYTKAMHAKNQGLLPVDEKDTTTTTKVNGRSGTIS
jgi:hypothetical protein